MEQIYVHDRSERCGSHYPVRLLLPRCVVRYVPHSQRRSDKPHIALTQARPIRSFILLLLLLNPRPQAEATWLPALDGCMVINSQSSQANVTVTMITDLFLLVAMLVGLLRRRQARAYSLWRVLWNQVRQSSSRDLRSFNMRPPCFFRVYYGWFWPQLPRSRP